MSRRVPPVPDPDAVPRTGPEGRPRLRPAAGRPDAGDQRVPREVHREQPRAERALVVSDLDDRFGHRPGRRAVCLRRPTAPAGGRFTTPAPGHPAGAAGHHGGRHRGRAGADGRCGSRRRREGAATPSPRPPRSRSRSTRTPRSSRPVTRSSSRRPSRTRETPPPGPRRGDEHHQPREERPGRSGGLVPGADAGGRGARTRGERRTVVGRRGDPGRQLHGLHDGDRGTGCTRRDDAPRHEPWDPLDGASVPEHQPLGCVARRDRHAARVARRCVSVRRYWRRERATDAGSMAPA